MCAVHSASASCTPTQRSQGLSSGGALESSGELWRALELWSGASHGAVPARPFPPSQAEGHVYGWYYPALKPWTHYVPFMVNHKDDILEVRCLFAS